MTPSDSEDEPSSKKFKRAYIACLNCRVRKVKCDLGDLLLPKDRCARCERERRDCVFVDLKKRSVVRVREKHENVEPEPENHHKDGAPKHFSTMEGALVFLANAAGKIATADERDKIDARKKHEQLEFSSGSLLNALLNMNLKSTLAVNLTNPRFYPEAASGGSTPEKVSLIPPYVNKPIDRRHRLAMPPAENSEVARPKSASDLGSIEYIGTNGILTVAEAEYLVHLFFTAMHPFFPHIPRFLHLPQVLSRYPILLCAILTISSRYHSLGESTIDGVAKNIEIHDRLWLYVQRLISQTVWAEASTRSIGTVFAFLLFTEWNPRAIHWRWSDYANKADDTTESRAATDAPLADEPAGLGAMRRSYRMAWMLIGSAVRLAQDTGFMELSSKTFLATHIAEINSVMNMSRRSMLAHLLAEVDLDHDEISEDDMEQREDNEYRVLNMSEEEQKRIPTEHVLCFTTQQRAQIELLQIMSVGHESLYGYKAQLGSLSQRQNLLVLNIMGPMLNNWGRRYRHLLVPSTRTRKPEPSELAKCIEAESLIFEFSYAKLYIYSLALSPSPKTRETFAEGKVTLKLDEISKSAKYIEQAFNAANEILLVAHRVHRLKLLRFMPVRWVTRIVRAVAFIVKCYLTITAHKLAESGDVTSGTDNFDSTILSLSLISVEEIVQSIQKAAITLRDCSPDELHLCTRYSNVLMYLCSEMKTKLKSYQADDEEKKDEPQRYEQPIPEPTNSFQEVVGGFNNVEAALNIGESEVMEWFMSNRNIGLDFVGPWTELIEQQLEGQLFNFDDGLS